MDTSDYTHQNALKTSAEWYISKGLEVTLLRKGEKIYKQIGAPPCNREQIAEHIVTGGNIGFRPGPEMLVVDIDIKSNKPGRKSYEALELPPTYTVKTPSGGFHCYFRKPANVRTKLSLPDYPGIDFLSGTTNVVCAGSSLTNGSVGTYAVVRDLPIADLPDDLVKRLARDKHDGKVKHHASDHDPESLARIKSVLDQLDTEKMDYDSWWEVVAIVNYECDGSAEGRQLAEKWSATFSRHDPAEFDKQWQHCDNTGTPKTFASLMFEGEDGTFMQRFQKLPSFAEVLGEVQCAELPLTQSTEAPQTGEGVVLDAESGEVLDAESTRAANVLAEVFPPGIEAQDGFVPGMAGDLARWIDSCSRFRHVDMAQIGALHCLSALAANKVVVGTTQVPVNLFTITTGSTGRGKETLHQCLTDFVGQYAPATTRTVGQREVQDHPVLERVSSGPALSRALAARQDRIWAIDEFAEFLGTLSGNNRNTHAVETVTGLLKYFARARGHVGALVYSRAEHGSDPVDFPYLSVVATTTPGKLADAVTEIEALDSGLINRAIIVACDETSERRRHVRKRPIPIDLMEQCTTLQGELSQCSAAQPLVIPVDDDASDFLWAQALRWDRETHYKPLWSRSYENSLKLAGLVALGTEGQTVTLPIARWAVNYISISYQSFIKTFEDNLGRDPLTEAKWSQIEHGIIKILESHKEVDRLPKGSEAQHAAKRHGVTLRTLQRNLNFKAKEFNTLLEDLESMGRIRRFEAEAGTMAKGKTRMEKMVCRVLVED